MVIEVIIYEIIGITLEKVTVNQDLESLKRRIDLGSVDDCSKEGIALYSLMA